MTLTFYGYRITLGRKHKTLIDAHVFSLRCEAGHEPLLLVRHLHQVFVLDPTTLKKAAIALPDGIENSEIVGALRQEDEHKAFGVTKGTALRTRIKEILNALNVKEQK